MRLENKVAIVTGAASGMGAATARLFAREGAKVVLTDLLEAEGREVAQSIVAAGGEARFHRHDVASEADNQALVERAEAAFGPVDLFCANAGIGLGTDPIATSPEDWARSIDVNVMAHVHAAKALLPGWLARGEGYFLATASADLLAEQRPFVWDPQHQMPVLECLHVILNEAWEHHRYAVRDLDAIEAT